MAAHNAAPLYGRRQAIARLAHACRQADPSRPLWVLTEGPAGIGKTSLVGFVRAAMQLGATQFGAGKFEQFHRQTPYGALIAALRSLLQAVLALPAPQQLQWREILHGAGEARLAPLADVLPELACLLGAMPALAPLPPKEAQARLEASLAGFLGCFARSGHPLLLFLDDLQWADVGTLRLLRNLDGEACPGHLIVLGTFRDNEVSALHPLAQLIEHLEAQPSPPVRIRLGPLTPADIADWMRDAYGLESPDAAQWLQQQSEGNPLFVSQLLGTLRERGVLRREGGAWQWHAAQLGQAQLEGSILGFMEARLRELPPQQQELLSSAASLGTEFGEDELMCILQQSREQVRSGLAAMQDARLAEHVRDGNWRFAHDRIQQAAYRLLPDQERRQRHLNIGRLLLSFVAPEALDAASFDLAAQFNHASELLTPAERLTVADLNLRAGRRAKAAAAYEAALGYFRAGHALLPELAWESHYALAFELLQQCAECAYAVGEHEQAGRMCAQALDKARDRIDRARIHGLMIMFTLNAGQAERAWQYGSDCLAEFGIALESCRDALAAAIEREEPALRRRLAAENPLLLMGEHAQCSGEQEAVADVLLRLYVAGYQLGKHPYAYITLRMLEFGLTNRHKPALAFGMMSFAVLLVSRHGAYAEAEGHAQVALQLAQQIDDTQLRSRIDYIYGSMVAHWTRPIPVGLQALERSYELALVNADKVYIGLALSFILRARIMSGEPVPQLMRMWEQTAPVIRQIESAPIGAMYEMNRQWLRALQGRTAMPARLGEDGFDEQAFAARLQSFPAKSPCHWFGLLQAILAYLHDEQELAQRWIADAEAHLDAVTGQIAIPEHYFWRALILHAAGDRQALADSVRKMDEWSAACPGNFGHRASLLRAEMLRADGHIDAALGAYHAAIDQAREHGQMLLLALAFERMGNYFVELRLDHQAGAWLQEAVGAWRAWGASAKVAQLRHRYSAHAGMSGQGDGDALLIASQSILAALGDIQLDRLLRQLLPLLGRASSASRTAAFIVREGELMLECEDLADPGSSEAPLPLPLRHADGYPVPFIMECCKLRQPMVLATPASHPQYGGLACWLQHPAAAVLCLPVLRHGRLLGALYMERRCDDSFAATLSLLESLLRQLGAAIENALLYADLEQQNAERGRAEKIAREGERRWRAFLEHARMAVLALDLSGTIEYVNPFLCEQFGYAEDELVGKDWTRVLLSPGENRPDLQSGLQAELLAHGHCNNLTWLRAKSGQERLIAWSISLLRDPDGRPIGSIGIGSDMTDQHRAEHELRQLNEELEQRVAQRTSDLAVANQDLDSFAYSISHDLRAPLRSIDGFSQALAEDCGAALDAQGQDYLLRVRKATRRMGGMIDAMLDMSRKTRGALAAEEVDLSALARDVLDELRQRAPQRRVRATVAPGLRVRADSRLMRVVLDNLIGNAWKYSAGNADAEIAFEAEWHDGVLAYCVRDNGSGFDMARAGKLFHAFQRLHADVEGHGIGLATAQRIIHRHGGRIWVHSEPGKGAAFYFTLAG